MTHVLSLINLKGGVGKTTLAVALAEAFSAELKKRVLVIDIDPQTNATVMLIGEERWRRLNDAGHTLARLFQDAVEPQALREPFSFGAALQRGASPVATAATVDLLPSSLDLIDYQDRLATIPSGPFFAVQPIELLMRSLRAHLSDYDLVIIDCPPNLGIITLNGLRISQAYIIPTVPDVLSTYGIPQILSRIAKFSAAISEPIRPLGIVVTKFQANSTVHKTTLKELRRRYDTAEDAPRVFDVAIGQANQMAAAAEAVRRSSFRQRWGQGEASDALVLLAGEILARLEGRPWP